MLEYIVDNIASKVAANFEKIIPIAEIVYSGEKSFPAEYINNGNYVPINVDNFAGLGYFRLTGKPTIQPAETKRPQKDVMKYTYPLKFVGCIKKSVLGKDDSYSANAICTVLAKRLEENNTALMSTLGANKATVKVSSFEFDNNVILNDEFKNVDGVTRGIPLDFCLFAIELTTDVEIRNDCIGIICNDYCGGLSPVLTSSAGTVARGGNIKFVYPVTITEAGVYAYNIAELNGKTLLFVQLGNIFLIPSQYTLVGSLFTITDTETEIYAGQYLNIGYRI
jgi:hypothetical protein